MVKTTSDCSVDDVLSQDHDRIDGHVWELVTALALGREDALKSAEAFVAALERHIRWEEETLFPAVPAARGIESLRADHERIRASLNDLCAKVTVGLAEEARVLLDRLRIFLAGHNRDEELGVYVYADRRLPEDQRRQMLESLPPLRE